MCAPAAIRVTISAILPAAVVFTWKNPPGGRGNPNPPSSSRKLHPQEASRIPLVPLHAWETPAGRRPDGGAEAHPANSTARLSTPALERMHILVQNERSDAARVRSRSRPPWSRRGQSSTRKGSPLNLCRPGRPPRISNATLFRYPVCEGDGMTVPSPASPSPVLRVASCTHFRFHSSCEPYARFCIEHPPHSGKAGQAGSILSLQGSSTSTREATRKLDRVSEISQATLSPGRAPLTKVTGRPAGFAMPPTRGPRATISRVSRAIPSSAPARTSISPGARRPSRRRTAHPPRKS